MAITAPFLLLLLLLLLSSAVGATGPQGEESKVDRWQKLIEPYGLSPEDVSKLARELAHEESAEHEPTAANIPRCISEHVTWVACYRALYPESKSDYFQRKGMTPRALEPSDLSAEKGMEDVSPYKSLWPYKSFRPAPSQSEMLPPVAENRS